MRNIKVFLAALVILSFTACSGMSTSDTPATTTQVAADSAPPITGTTPRSSPTPLPSPTPTPSTRCQNYNFFWNVENDFTIDMQRLPVVQQGSTIIYEGAVPHLSRYDRGVEYAGGLPQIIDMDTYLHEIEVALDWQVPDPAYAGLVAFDYEAYPLLWADLDPRFFSQYRNGSIALVRNQHPTWSPEQLEAEAGRQYEQAIQNIFTRSIEKVHQVRPQARVGFYGQPAAYRWNGYETPNGDARRAANDRLAWLWQASDVLFPVLYFFDPTGYVYPSGWLVTEQQQITFVQAAVEESRRVAGTKPVIPFVWYRYMDNDFMIDIDLRVAFMMPYQFGADAVLIWGNEKNQSTATRQEIQRYFDSRLGPQLNNFKTAGCVVTGS